MSGRPRYLAFVAAIVAGFSGTSASAAEIAGEQAVDFGGLHWIDWVVVAVYAASILLVGWWYSRRQSNVGEYFIGGGSMNSFLIGISLFATLLSTISYLSYPGEMIKHGPVFLCGLLSIPIAYVVVGYILIPSLMRQRVSSAYQLLEVRLGDSIRLLGATLFIVLRIVWMSVMVFMASTALAVMVGVDMKYVPLIVLLTGLVSITYTSMGGLRAVVVSDFLQFCFLLTGAVLTVGIVSMKMNGFEWFPREWAPNWDTQPFFSIDPTVRVTVVGMILMQLVFRICTAGGDQTAIQRYMATENARSARRAYLVNCIVNIIVVGALALVGFALLGFYEYRPDYLPEGWDIAGSADELFPHFIANHLPVGISGLVVAAMFAAAMSSIDSGVNSITAVIMNDYLGRFRKEPVSDGQQVRIAKMLAWGIGFAVVVVGSQVGAVPGNFLEVVQRTTGMFIAPLFGLFILALFSRAPNAFGAGIGTLYGFLTGTLIAYWDVLTGLPALSFQYILVGALGSQLAIAAVASRTWRLVTGKSARRIHLILWLVPVIAGIIAVIL